MAWASFDVHLQELSFFTSFLLPGSFKGESFVSSCVQVAHIAISFHGLSLSSVGWEI